MKKPIRLVGCNFDKDRSELVLEFSNGWHDSISLMTGMDNCIVATHLYHLSVRVEKITALDGAPAIMVLNTGGKAIEKHECCVGGCIDYEACAGDQLPEFPSKRAALAAGWSEHDGDWYCPKHAAGAGNLRNFAN